MIAFLSSSQEVTVNEGPPGNTDMVCVAIRSIPGPGSMLGTAITANLEFGPAGGRNIAGELFQHPIYIYSILLTGSYSLYYSYYYNMVLLNINLHLLL